MNAIDAAAKAMEEAEKNPVMIDCPRCKGRGYHHGFGEHGHDPDWCDDCGGTQHIEHPTHRACATVLAFLDAAQEPDKEADKAINEDRIICCENCWRSVIDVLRKSVAAVE